jgi:hypothetical protein
MRSQAEKPVTEYKPPAIESRQPLTASLVNPSGGGSSN